MKDLPPDWFAMVVLCAWCVLICLALVTLLYAGTAVMYLLKRDFAWALVWAAYALANVGLIAVMLRGQP